MLNSFSIFRRSLALLVAMVYLVMTLAGAAHTGSHSGEHGSATAAVSEGASPHADNLAGRNTTPYAPSTDHGSSERQDDSHHTASWCFFCAHNGVSVVVLAVVTLLLTIILVPFPLSALPARLLLRRSIRIPSLRAPPSLV